MQPSASHESPNRSVKPPSCGVAKRGLPRLPEKDDAEELHHDIPRERGGKRNQRAPSGSSMLMNVCGTSCANRNDCSNSHSDTNPFNGGSPAMASAPTRVQPGNPWHAMDETAEVPEVALPGRVNDRARSQKQQTLHERMIHRVIHDGDQGERRRGAHVRTGEDDREPETGEHEPDCSRWSEYASRCFISVCAAAKTTPYSALNRPRARGARPHHHTGWPRDRSSRESFHTRHLEHDAAHQRRDRRRRGGCASGSQT